MRLGTALVDVTPPPDAVLAGGAFGRAAGIDAPLLATVLFLERDGVRTLLCSCDCIGFDDGLADETRAAMGRAAGCPPDAVCVAGTHTHNGPVTLSLRGWGDGDPGYRRELVARLAGAAGEAAAAPVAVDCHPLLARAQEHCRNRSRFGDGVDDALVAVGLREAGGGGWRAAVVGYGCHPVTMHGTGRIHPDYPGELRRVLAEELGAGCATAFFLGACGDVNPAGFAFAAENGDDPARIDRCRADARRLGGDLARRVADGLRRAPSGDDRLEIAARRVALPLEPPPGPEARSRRLAELARRAAELPPDADPWRRAEVAVERRWLDEVATAPQADRDEVAVFDARIGPVRLLGLPLELFATYGRRLRAATAEPLIIASLANGYRGYLCTDGACRAATYEAAFVPKLLGRPVFAPGAAEALVAAL